MNKRLLKKRQYSWLASELAFLTGNGTLSKNLSDRILDNYEVEPEHRMDRGRLLLITFSSLGVLMFGFAVFLLLCYNWNYLAPLYRITITAGSLLLFFALGSIFKAMKKGLLSELAFFFTGILFGVNIWQIAQSYHFNIYFNSGLWLWALGLLLLAVGRKLPLLHYLSAAVLILWVPAEITTARAFTFIYEYCPWLPCAAWSLPILAGIGYYCGRKNDWISVRVIYFLLFTWWTAWQVNNFERLLPFYFIFLGGLNLLAVRYVRSNAIIILMKIWGFALIFFFMPFLTFVDFYSSQAGWIYTGRNPINLYAFAAQMVVCFVLGFPLLLQYVKSKAQKDGARLPLGEVTPLGEVNLNQNAQSLDWLKEDPAGSSSSGFLRRFFPGIIAVLFVPLFIWYLFFPQKELLGITAISASLIMLFAAWGGILYPFSLISKNNKEQNGYNPSKNEKSPGSFTFFKIRNNGGNWSAPFLFWFGILYFILWSIFRYIDLFAESFGMPGAAAMFALIGAILLIAGVFWSKYSTRLKASENPPTTPTDLENQIPLPVQIQNNENSDQIQSENSVQKYLNPETELDRLRKEIQQKKAISISQPLTVTEKIFLTVTFLFMIGTLIVMLGSQIIPFQNAKKITVETEPVDPRSMFRGDYVTLRYSFNSTNGVRWENNNKQTKIFDVTEIKEERENRDRILRSAYITLRFDSEKKIWKPVKMTVKRPEAIEQNEVYLRGRFFPSGWTVRYGIESFFVQQGSGKRIEQAMRRGNNSKEKVYADLLVAPNGKVRIVDVRIVEATP